MVGYALDVGLRYLRSKKRESISVISVIAISGVALGVAALLAVMSITSGFQREFRDKVVGVNAHVLVLKYGLNFDEYRDVIARARKLPEVAGAAPFIINEMMLAKGDRLSGVLVKGIDPQLMPAVLDLPSQLIQGGLEGLRLPGKKPAVRADEENAALSGQTPDDGADPADLDQFLTKLSQQDADTAAPQRNPQTPQPTANAEPATRANLSHELTADQLAQREATNRAHANTAKPPAAPKALAPKPQVPTPEAMAAALEQADLTLLPSDDTEERWIQQTAPVETQQDDDRPLPGIIIGATLAHELGAALGDRVKIISPLTGVDTSLVRTGSRAPKSRDFKVIAIFQAGFQEYDSKLVYVDLYEAQAFQDQGDSVVGVEMSLHNIEQSADVAVRLERDLGGGPFHTLDWKELNHNLFTALEMQKIMLSLVIATIIFVAAFNVVATLIMIVLEKRREIAILKAMGAKDGAILQIFMVQGAAIGGVGTSIGLLIGGAICAYLHYFRFPLDPKVYLIDHLPIRTSWTEFVATVVIALGICVFATLIPSLWAARMLPADGVRPQ